MSKLEKGYNGNLSLKRQRTKLDWTQNQLMEFVKCKNDPIYFAQQYIKITHVDHGLIPIDLYDYQKDIIDSTNKHRNTIVLTGRQQGKTTTAVCLILHYVIFNSYKLVALLANKGDAAREILSRIQLAYENLPKWLQQGVVEWNKGSVELENGCKILASSTSGSAIRGKSCSFLYIDEVAFVHNWSDFYTSVYPTLSSGKETKMLFTSTPNSLNHFYEFWEGATKGTNNFNPIKATWGRVPGRDGAWKQATLESMNFDMDKFAQEFEGEFIGSSGTLISGATLKRLTASYPLSSKDGLSIYTEKLPNRVYTMDCDVSHGKGLDYSAFSVIDVTELPYKQVATYRNNLITPKDYAEIINNVGRYYNDAYLLVENNDIGSQVTYILWNEFEYAHMLSSQGAGRHGKKLVVGVGSKTDYGIRMTSSVKKLGCSILKLLIEQNQLIIVDKDTITELSRFSKKNDSYAAEEGCTDDMVMGLVNFAWMSTTECFKEISGQDVVGDMTDFDDDELSIKLLGMGVKYDGVDDVIAYEKFDGDDDLWVKHDYPIGSWG
jgi:Terminase large subunit, T4likevirus-type, N-terminal/Terminase RNaseH-like domain